MREQDTKWVATWGNGISQAECREADYAKNITLRYPVISCFDGSAVRLHFSNYTATEPVTLSKVTLARSLSGAAIEQESLCNVTFGGKEGVTLQPGEQIVSDAIDFLVQAKEAISISIYLQDYTQMREGVITSGPMSEGYFFYGDYAKEAVPPERFQRRTQCFYFLDTVDIWTEEKNHALICFGDSITAQSWPDELQMLCWKEHLDHVSVIRRAVSGSRILREYDCIEYAAYGLKGETRFPLETDTAGADSLILLHGINDIIHPVGEEINIFRPLSELPTAQELIDGVQSFYLEPLKNADWRIYSATVLPFGGWRTYAPFREELREKFNEWLRTAKVFDACIDFDRALRDPKQPQYMLPEYDSGDHLHPEAAGHYRMAQEAFRIIKQHSF